MERLAHGYTNRTSRVGDSVIKVYAGPDAAGRAGRESRALDRLTGRIPVPPLQAVAAGEVRTGWVSGCHGQDLINAGHAREVLRACGAVLQRIHAVDPGSVLADPVGAGVLVHGDFGPNNVLLGPDFAVVAVLDWEWVHRGDPVEDLAWCEWILRMHHRGQAAALPALFAGYGAEPAWPDRQAWMLRRCRELLNFTRRWDAGGSGVRQWEERLGVTASWSERPG